MYKHFEQDPKGEKNKLTDTRMKSVLTSIQPKWCKKIANGEKTIEVRKSRPKLETPFKVYIYCTIGNGVKGDYLVPSGIQCGKVIGEFVCDEITPLFNVATTSWELLAGNVHEYAKGLVRMARLTEEEMHYYAKGKYCYAWHISQLKIYDKPKELSEFYTRCNIPESKCKFCDNCYDREDYYGRHYAVKKLTRPPQSWCYVEV